MEGGKEGTRTADRKDAAARVNCVSTDGDHARQDLLIFSDLQSPNVSSLTIKVSLNARPIPTSIRQEILVSSFEWSIRYKV
jgi:hypothetical protein